MSMLLSSLINGCRNGRSDLIKPKTSDVAAQLADLAIIVSAVAVGTLLMFGVLGFGLSGPLTIGLQWGLIGLGAAFIAIDVGTWVTRALLNKNTLKDTPLSAEMIRRIAAAESPTAKQKEAAKKQNCHQIWGGLYLGDRFAATECVSMDGLINKTSDNTDTESTVFFKVNPNEFKVVATLCPIFCLLNNTYSCDDFERERNENIQQLAKEFEKNITKWFRAGETIANNPEIGFKVLAYNCTDHASILDKSKQDNLETICNQKKDTITKTPVNKWFNLVFDQIDAAIAGNTKMLVHCFSENHISTTLLAAYLINRFEVSPTEAVDFLKQKRACVEPAFINQLEEYSRALAQSRQGADHSENSEDSEYSES